jgi:hypothetical protein
MGADAASSERTVRLHNEVGSHLQMIAGFQGARAACERALALDENASLP